MNSYMNIQVRVLSGNSASQIRQLQAQVRQLQTQLAATNATASSPSAVGGARSRKSLAAWGNQLQWTGRQLQYNWTLPIALAGAAATKFALENEAAMTRVSKVYGDTADATAYFTKHQDQIEEGFNAGTMAAEVFNRELDALGGAFEAMSSRYGVAQKEVLETASAWAAAGVSGVALSKSTELSIRTAILGDMELAKATESLIGIQSQYSLSVDDLTLAMAELNAIENATGISTAGLIDGFTRSAGVAREAGVDVRHLGAMLAALVPATGTAATAGNALKTIISRLMSPTKDAADVMREFGINTSDAAWQSSTAMERLTILARKMGDDLKQTGNETKELADNGYELSDSQKQVVATVLGSRYQMNRFLVLMRELNEEHGYYQKALDSTKNDEQVFATASRELNNVLESSPKRLEILWYTLQNGMANAIQPFIPYLLYFVSLITRTMDAFQNLDPALQKFIILGVAALAVVGPLIRYFGSLATLVFYLGKPFGLLGGVVSAAFGAIFMSTRTVDGELTRVRRNWGGLISSMLLTPFRFLFAGFGALGGIMLVSALKVLRFARAFPLMVGLVFTSLKSLLVIWRATSAAMIAIWTVAWAKLRIVSTLGALAQVGIMGRLRAMLLVITSAMWASMRVLYAGGWASLRMLSTRGIVAILALSSRLLSRGLLLAIASPWGIAIAAVALILWKFRSEIGQIWNNIVSYFADGNNALVRSLINAWNSLPQGVSNALVAVARVVQTVALQIYEWFSYINPWAHHSPSLVENVMTGTTAIIGMFGGMSTAIGQHVLGAYRDINAFGRAIASLTGGASSFEAAQERAKIKKFAPGALEQYDQLRSRLKSLQDDLAKMEVRVARQEAVVDRWKKKLDEANAALDRQQGKLDRLTDSQTKWQDKLDEANDRLTTFANAPIRGMQEFSDRIFENEMAQKRLRLEMMKIEDAGGSIDEIQDKMERLRGTQDMLSGERDRLRMGGAGSDVTGYLDQQISALEQQQQAYENAAKPLQDMQTELDNLARAAERLDLEQSLKFDPLTRQIEQAANAMKELPFEEIMAGVTKAQGDIEKYGSKLDAATEAVKAQQAVVDELTKARDAYQQRLDREEKTLDTIKGRYDEVADAISAVEQALSDASSAADTMQQKMDKLKEKKKGDPYVSPAVQNFRDAAGGNFADVGGAGLPMRSDFSDQSEAIKKEMARLADETAGVFGDINPFGPIRGKWDKFVSWWNGVWGPFAAGAKDFFSHMFDGVGLGDGLDVSGFYDKILIGWHKAQSVIDTIVKVVGAAWRLFWPSISEFAENAWDGIKNAFGDIWGELSKFGDEFGDLGSAFRGFWNVAKIYLGFFLAQMSLIGKVVFSILAKTIKPAIETIGKVLANLIQVVRGIFQVISGFFMLFTSDWRDGLKKMGAGVLNILSGLGGAIGQLLWGLAKVAVKAVWGLVKGVWDWFMWLWDELVGHSIIPDIVNGIVFWFKKLITVAKWIWSNVVMPILKVFKELFDLVIAAVKLWWTGITLAWTVLATLGQWFWDNVLKPVWNFVSGLWSNYVQPGLVAWWEGIKGAWNLLTGLGQWFWDNVLKPVWNFVKALWNDYVEPGLKGWWDGVKKAWNGLLNAGQWYWNNVLKPVWNFVKALWNDYVGPALKGWWEGIKNRWNQLTGLGQWFWTSIMQPVVGKVQDAWEAIKTKVSEWWTKLTNIWSTGKDALTGLGGWFETNVTDPIFKKMTGVFTNIKNWMENNLDIFKSPMKSIVNVVIDAVNTIIKGLNKVSSILPGIDFEITTIERLAAGGEVPTRRGNRGFKTTGARAIVGEGKANYPEFVIPTDPTHRNRARSLLAMANTKINGGVRAQGNGIKNSTQRDEHGLPMYSVGGWLSDRWKDAKNLGDEIAKLPREAAGKIMDPLLDAGRSQVSKINWQPLESPPMFAMNKIEEWVKATDQDINAGIKKYSIPAGGSVSVTTPDNPTGHAAWKGGTFTNNFIAHMKKAEQVAKASIQVMQGGFRPATSYSGTSHQGDAVDLRPNNALIKGLRAVGIAAGDRTGLGNWSPHTHAIPGPSAGSAAGSAVWQWSDYMAKGGASQPLKSAWGLKEGGIALASRGPTLAMIGDGRYDEAVVPLPKGFRQDLIGSGSGDRVINIYGNLEFPNVKDGSDAEDFLTNLENLAS